MNDIKTMTQIKKLCEEYMYYYATGGGGGPAGDSYVQLSNGELIYFDATNTTVNDIVNFTFNGQNVDRYFIQHLSFDESYLTVTSLPDGFCSYMDNLLSVNTNNFINVTSVGVEVFANLYSLEDFDFTNFGNLVNAGDKFLISMNSIVSIDLSNINENFNAAGYMLARCQTISEIIINDTDTTNINFGSYFLHGVPNDSSRKIVATNNGLVNIFKSKAQDNAISEWSGLVENDSYIQLANGELIYFNATNTPVANFAQDNYIINNQPVNAGLIKHIDFGDSYLSVTSLPNYFCFDLGIETVGLSGLANVTVFGYENFAYTRSLKHFDFTVFNGPISASGFSNFLINSAIESVDISQYHVESNLSGAFIDCMNLKEIIINDTDFSNHGDMSYWFYRVNNDSSRKIKASSQELVDILKSKTHGNISEWSKLVESYYTLVSDPTTEIPFHIDNTPFANFCNSGNAALTITINGQSVVKNTIKELSFGDEYSITTTISSNFLRCLSSLSTVDLSVFSNVTSIGDGFLRDCSSLTSVDLSALSNVTSVGFSFLQSCSSLTSIDLSPLSNVTSSVDGFLSGCSGLTSIDLSPLSNVTSVRNGFLNSCTSLTSIDLSPLSNVTTINNTFLQGCRGLTSVDLSGLSNVTSVGHSFLNGCFRLTSVDLSSFSNVTSIGFGILNGCSGLTSVTIDAGDWSTKTIGVNPMYGVENLSTNTVISNTSCELANNFKTAIGENISNWTVECPAPVVESYYTLVSDPETRIEFHIDNTPLANFCTSGGSPLPITINGQSVVKNTIKELSFGEEYSNTTVIPQYFLKELVSLSTVDLSTFSNVTSIRDNFLYYCLSLTSIDLSPFSNVTSIGTGFLNNCTSLTSVTIDAGDWSTKTVGNYAMQYVNNYSTNKVISNTSCVLANNFKTKFGSAISRWTVECPQ